MKKTTVLTGNHQKMTRDRAKSENEESKTMFKGDGHQDNGRTEKISYLAKDLIEEENEEGRDEGK